MSDFSLTFDATPFLNGIKKITHGLSSIGDTSKQIEKNSSNLKDTMGSAINGLIAKVGALGGAYLGLRSILSNLPEIGKAWEIAGGIMKRNFFWPLRQEIAPYLQKFLNWTRDHRTLFVQWGQVLVNVFRTVKQTIMNLFEAIRPIIETFGKRFKEIFGGSVKSVSDAVNIIAFRLFVLATLIIEYFKPVIELFDNITDAIWEMGKSFLKGLRLEKLIMSFSRMVDSIKELTSSFKLDLAPAIKIIIDSFEILGDSIYVIGITLEGIIKMLSAIGKAKNTSELFKNLKTTSFYNPDQKKELKEMFKMEIIPIEKGKEQTKEIIEKSKIESLKTTNYKTEKNINTPKAEVNINNLNLYGDKKEESQSQLFQMINDAIEKAMRNNLNKHGASVQ